MGKFTKLVVLLGLILTVAMSAPFDAGSKYNVTNITDSPDNYELNPSFAEQGKSILFMLFTGDVDDPRPWDYILCKSDLYGHTWSYVSTAGVIDYRVQDNRHDVLILRTDPDRDFEGSDMEFYSSRCDWEIWQLDLRTEKQRLVEDANNQPIALGYARLGVTGLPDFERGRSVKRAPDGKRKIIVQREKKQGRYFFTFYQQETESRHEIHSTEAWQSYRDTEWFPPIVWLDNSTFLTVAFRSNFHPKFPQSEGFFSIVNFNLNNANSEVVYEAESLEPFTNLCYNPNTADIFFQRMNANTKKTELCQLNSNGKAVEIVYESDGQLGKLKFDYPGTEMVLTEFQHSGSDIMRLTLRGQQIQRLVNK